MKLKPKSSDESDDEDSELTSDTKSVSRPLTPYESQLEDEVETLHNALFSLSSHFAKVQFRLRQITNASTCERQRLLRELEHVSCEGLDGKHAQDELPSLLCDARSMGDVRAKQRSIIKELRNQLEDLTECSTMCFGIEEDCCVSLGRRRYYSRNSDGCTDYAYEDEKLDEREELFEPKHGTSCMCCRCRNRSTTAYSGCSCEDDMVAREFKDRDDFLYQREPKMDKRKFIRERGYLPQSWNIDKCPQEEQEETFTCTFANTKKIGQGKKKSKGNGRSKSKSKKRTQSLDTHKVETAWQKESAKGGHISVGSNGRHKPDSKRPCRCIKCWFLAGDKKAASSPDLGRSCNSKHTRRSQKSKSVRKSVKSFKNEDDKEQVTQIENKPIQNRDQVKEIDRKRESKGSIESLDRDGSENSTTLRNPIGIKKSALYYKKDDKEEDKKMKTSSSDTSQRDSESSQASDRIKSSSSRSDDAKRVDKSQQPLNVKKQKCECCYCKRRFVEDFKKTFEKYEPCSCNIIVDEESKHCKDTTVEKIKRNIKDKKVKERQKGKNPAGRNNEEQENKEKLKKQQDHKKLIDAKNKKYEEEKKNKFEEEKKKLEQQKKRNLEEEKKKFEEEKKKNQEEKRKLEDEEKKKHEEEKKKFEEEEAEKKQQEEEEKKQQEEEEEEKKNLEEKEKLPIDKEPTVSSPSGVVEPIPLDPQTNVKDSNDVQNQTDFSDSEPNQILRLSELEEQPKSSNEVNCMKPILKTCNQSDVSKQRVCKPRQIPPAPTSTCCCVQNCSKCGQHKKKKKKICFDRDCKYKTQR